ncbi:UNVERIFIED_CONTAM: hypothetical protein Sradi_3970000 [Sesamum radiatum]|uniref:Uncharacterized protein n=1 Tax=Sesamum radiatum TaxID=300843 RepID=A0AAW2PI75_SESRA
MDAVAFHLSITSFMNSLSILIHHQVYIIHLMEKIAIFILELLYHKVPDSRGKAVSLGDSRAPARSRNLHPSFANSPRRLQNLKEHFVQRATDRRRGVVEDLHLAIEIFIESAFDFLHKAAHCLLAPGDTLRRVSRWFSSQRKLSCRCPVTSVSTSVLSDNDPAPTEKKATFHGTLNTDARTCQDVITELGYVKFDFIFSSLSSFLPCAFLDGILNRIYYALR